MNIHHFTTRPERPSRLEYSGDLSSFVTSSLLVPVRDLSTSIPNHGSKMVNNRDVRNCLNNRGSSDTKVVALYPNYYRLVIREDPYFTHLFTFQRSSYGSCITYGQFINKGREREMRI